jgi:Zn-dependent protease with chaperone function
MHSTAILSTELCLVLTFPVWAAQPCGDGPRSALDVDYLIRCRPTPVSAAERNTVLATLPPQGEVRQFTQAQRAKLDAVALILGVYGRDRIWDVKCIDVPLAWTGLFAGTVILISLAALNLLSAGELQALAAHEAGHAYLLADWELARGAKDGRGRREVESRCDRIAVLALAQLGARPDDLAGAIEKIYLYNRTYFGNARDEVNYPAAQERAKSIRFFARGR